TTPDHQKRLRQQNGEIAAGAERTKAKRPRCFFHGFIDGVLDKYDNKFIGRYWIEIFLEVFHQSHKVKKVFLHIKSDAAFEEQAAL
ncbi:39413_t:CDS:2, partial [Gigaspora margarita]